MAAFAVWAKQMAAGDWLCREGYHPNMNWMSRVAPIEQFEQWWGGKQVYHQTPLYAYVLAISYRLFDSATPVLWLQVILSSLSLLLVFDLGRRFLDARAGLIAAALAAVFPPSIVLDTFLLRESLGASFTLVSVWLLLRIRDHPRGSLAATTGAVLAASCLLRETGIVLLVVGPALLFLEQGCRREWRRWAPALVAGAVTVLAPFVARNLVLGVGPFHFSTRGPETALQANIPNADPGFMTTPPPDRYVALMNEGSGSLTAALTTAYRQWPRGGYRSSMPWLWWQKVLCVFGDYEYSNNVNFYFFRKATPILAMLPTFGWFVGLALVGMVLLGLYGRQRQAALIPLAGGGALLLGCLLGFAMGRYRMPLAVLLAVPAGATVSLVVAWLQERRFALAGISVLTAAVLSVLSFHVAPKHAVFAGTTEIIYEGDVRRIQLEGRRLRVKEYSEAGFYAAAAGDTGTATEITLQYLTEYERFLDEVQPMAAGLFEQDRSRVGKQLAEQTDLVLRTARSITGRYADEALHETFEEHKKRIVDRLNAIRRPR